MTQDDIKLGNHTLKQRNDFIQEKLVGYMKRHPEANHQKARKYARVKWARKVNKELKKLQHVNKIRIKQ